MRETVIYIFAFLLILGGGAYLILPRVLEKGDPQEGPARTEWRPALPVGIPDDGPEAPTRRPVIAAVPVEPLLDASLTALPKSITVTLQGELGALRGPLKEVVGARIVAQTDGAESGHVLQLEPTAAVLSFGAVGHQWVSRSIADFPARSTVILPHAADPVVIRVRESDGTPAKGIPLRVRPRSPLGARRTDASGTLVLDDLAPGFVEVDCTSRERTGPILRLRTGSDRDQEVTLDPAWEVTGIVRSPGGRGVEGATVEAFGPRGPLGRTVTTDERGRFRWMGPVVGLASFRIHAKAYAELAVEARPPPVGAQGAAARRTDLGAIEFQAPAARLSVNVHFAVPDAYATVEVEPRAAAIAREIYGPGQILDAPRVRRIARGESATFEGLPVGIPLRVSVRGAGVPVDGFIEPEAAQDLELDVAPDAGHVVAGIVRDLEQKPVAGLRVLLSAEPRDGDGRLPDDIEVFTGVGGAFQVFGVPWRVAYVRAYPAGARSVLRRVELPVAKALDIRLEAPPFDDAHRLIGVVRDDQGQALPGVTVQAGGRQTRTNESGRFRLDGIVTAHPQVRVVFGYEPGPIPDEAPHPRAFPGRGIVTTGLGTDRELALTLARGVRLSFEAVDPIDETPVDFVHAVVRGPDQRVLFDRVLATTKGRVQLPSLAAFHGGESHPRGVAPKTPVTQGGMELFLCLPSGRHDAKIPIGAGRSRDLGRLPMKRGMLIRGIVRTQRGDPLPRARVSGMDAGWQNRGTEREREREMLYRVTETDDEGRFVLQGFNPRRGADLVVWVEDHAPIKHNVLLPPFSDKVDVDVEIQLEEGATLLLILEDGGTERPVEGALMDIEYARDKGAYLDLLHFGAFSGPIGTTREWVSATELLLFATRAAGNYRLGPLRPGPYELWIEHPAYQPVSLRLTLPRKGESIFDDVTYQYSSRKAGVFEKTSIAFMGSTLRIIIPMEGR